MTHSRTSKDQHGASSLYAPPTDEELRRLNSPRFPAHLMREHVDMMNVIDERFSLAEILSIAEEKVGIPAGLVPVSEGSAGILLQKYETLTGAITAGEPREFNGPEIHPCCRLYLRNATREMAVSQVPSILSKLADQLTESNYLLHTLFGVTVPSHPAGDVTISEYYLDVSVRAETKKVPLEGLVKRVCSFFHFPTRRTVTIHPEAHIASIVVTTTETPPFPTASWNVTLYHPELSRNGFHHAYLETLLQSIAQPFNVHYERPSALKPLTE